MVPLLFVSVDLLGLLFGTGGIVEGRGIVVEEGTSVHLDQNEMIILK